MASKKKSTTSRSGSNNSLMTNKYSLSDTEINELRTAFKLLDKNQDGRISVSEFQLMLKNFGIDVPDRMVAALMKEASKSGEGYLTENEFLAWVSGYLSQAPRDFSQDLVSAFRVFDKDNNGYITRDELKSAMEMIGEPVSDQDVNNMIEVADLDKDGKIDYNEFVKLLS